MQLWYVQMLDNPPEMSQEEFDSALEALGIEPERPIGFGVDPDWTGATGLCIR